jgi:N-acetylglucosaminyl-diphospho-decaprenol L-rhamnosyltransferase
MTSNISIIVITYNSEEIIKRFLTQPILKKINDIIVIDNASSDNTKKIVKLNMPSAKLISLKKNIGYGSAVNKGINSIKNKYLLVTNPDILFSSSFIYDLKIAIKNNFSWGLLAPSILDKNTFSKPPTSQFHLNKKIYSPLKDKKVTFISGACFLINPTIFLDKKIFDENIFMFFEDNDLSERVSHMNLDLFVLRNCFVFHEGENSSGNGYNILKLKNIHYGWSECYFNKKYNPGYKALSLNILSILKYLKRVIIFCLILNKRRFLISWFRLKGKLEFLKGTNSKSLS